MVINICRTSCKANACVKKNEKSAARRATSKCSIAKLPPQTVVFFNVVRQKSARFAGTAKPEDTEESQHRSSQEESELYAAASSR